MSTLPRQQYVKERAVSRTPPEDSLQRILTKPRAGATLASMVNTPSEREATLQAILRASVRGAWNRMDIELMCAMVLGMGNGNA